MSKDKVSKKLLKTFNSFDHPAGVLGDPLHGLGTHNSR
jgi:hypothetical protein